MSNTYAINTTRGREFAVEQEMIDLGLAPWVPRRLDSRYIKEKRAAVWYDVAYVPKLIFCVFPAVYWQDVVGLKHVIGKPTLIPAGAIKGSPGYVVKGTDVWVPPVYGLDDFQRAVDREYEDATRRKENSEYQCSYVPGQALEVLSGPFEGLPTTFTRSLKRAHDDYAKLRVEVEVMGRPTPLDIAPDMVRAT